MSTCAPVSSCPCETWAIPPGVTWPLRIDWSRWLGSVPGFDAIHSIAAVTLTDLNVSPPVPPVPADIALVSGMDPDPAEFEPGFTRIIADGLVTENLVRTSATLRIGNVYRLDMTIRARDCAGRAVTSTECVFINIVRV